MKFLRKIKENLFPDESSFFQYSWLITRIANKERFIEFVLLQTPEGRIWTLGDDYSLETANQLSLNNLNPEEFTIKEAIRKNLIKLLPELKMGENIITHSIKLPDGNLFFKSYDNLTCVWISKIIPEYIMDNAAKEYDFDYVEHDDSKNCKN